MRQIYLVTCEDDYNSLSRTYITRFFSKKRAIKEYKACKAEGLKQVRLSKVINI